MKTEWVKNSKLGKENHQGYLTQGSGSASDVALLFLCEVVIKYALLVDTLSTDGQCKTRRSPEVLSIATV